MPSTSSDDDVVDGEIVGEGGTRKEFDPRKDFLEGFKEGRPDQQMVVDSTLERELAALLNKYSRESLSNTPDYVLAKFLLGCLSAFEIAVNVRDQRAG